MNGLNSKTPDKHLNRYNRQRCKSTINHKNLVALDDAGKEVKTMGTHINIEGHPIDEAIEQIKQWSVEFGYDANEAIHEFINYWDDGMDPRMAITLVQLTHAPQFFENDLDELIRQLQQTD